MLDANDLKLIGGLLDERFLKVNEKFSKIDENFSKIDENFSKIDEKFSKIDEKFSKIDEKFSKIDERFSQLDENLHTMEDRIVGSVGEAFEQNFLPMVEVLIDEKLAPIESKLTTIETTMVMKSYLDDKLADLKGDLVGNDRILEKRTDVLVDSLAGRHSLKASDLERLEQARLFPRSPQQ